MTLRLLLVTGSTRPGSSNSAALRTARELVGESLATVYDGLAELPAFNPDEDHEPLPAAVVMLRKAIAAADAVIFCTPEYAGTLPGSFKNLLDWTVGGSEMYGKPAAWINVAGPGRGTGADATLATVLGYVGAAVADSSGLRVPVAHDTVGADGLIGDPATRENLADALATLVAELQTARPDGDT
jgi:chromate reductase